MSMFSKSVALLLSLFLPTACTERTASDAAAGKLAFESKCLVCHSVGQGAKVGPDMVGVTRRRSDEWLAKWLRSPEALLDSDVHAKAMLKGHDGIPMPNQGFSDVEIRQYIAYFHWLDAQPKSAGSGG
jgi:nitrite reductase (NO-forming)